MAAEKNRNDRSACVNIFSENLLTDKFRHYLRMSSTSCYWLSFDFYTMSFLYYLHLYLYSLHWLLHHILIFAIHYSTRFSFLQIASSLLRNWSNRTNDTWGGFFLKSISLNENFSFWNPKVSFTEMFHESIEKHFNWNLILRYTVKSTLN